MVESTDSELLEQFVRNQSETAFAHIVERHIGLVHSVAARHAANPQQAEDVTQAVFIILARKAASLGRQRVLAGWLYHTARLTAANFQRAESRRIRREQEAFMQSSTEEPVPDVLWSELSPLLDVAMGHLGAADRDALVLRYFQNKTLPEVGVALGIEHRAAQKRVGRALEKLRKIFSKRGVALSATAIAGSISANSVHAAPTGLAQVVAATGVAKGAAATGSTLTIMKGALKIMAWTKVKTAAVAGASLLLACGTITAVKVMAAHKTASSKEEIYEQIWAHPNSDSISLLNKAPEGFVIRPTRYPALGGGLWTDGGRGFWVNDDVRGLIGIAYNWSAPRTIFPSEMPSGSFDVMENLGPGQNAPAFKAEIEKQFGLVAHPEERETDVFLLKVADSAMWNRYRVKKGQSNIYRSGDNSTQKMHFKTATMSEIAEALEDFFDKPMLDRTGVQGDYTFDVQWDARDTGTARVAEALRKQLAAMGLEVIDGREKVKMLIVEKVK